MADAGVVEGKVEIEALESAPTVAAYELYVSGGGGEKVREADKGGCEFVFGLTRKGPSPVGCVVDNNQQVSLTMGPDCASVAPGVDV